MKTKEIGKPYLGVAELDVTQVQVLAFTDNLGLFNITDFGAATAGADVSQTGPGVGDRYAVDAVLDARALLRALDPNGLAFAISGATTNATGRFAGGVTQGSETETLTIDVSAYLPSAHAVIQLKVNDSLGLNFSATGFTSRVAVNLVNNNTSTAQVLPVTGTAPSRAMSEEHDFNLEKFAAAVLNTASVSIQFVASRPGETLHVAGHDTLTIDASVTFLAGGLGSAVVDSESLHLASKSTIVFDAAYHPGGGMIGHSDTSNLSLPLLHV